MSKEGYRSERDGCDQESDGGTSNGDAPDPIQRAEMCPLEDECTSETQQGSSRISTDDIAQTNGDAPQDSRSPLS